jgi:hypothetical protein
MRIKIFLFVTALAASCLLLVKVGPMNAQTDNTVTLFDSPLPTPTPVSPEAMLAIQFIAEQYKLPVEQLTFGSEEPVTFPLLGRNYIYVTVQHNATDQFQLFSVLVDPVTKAVEPDYNAVRAAENATYYSKYGKFEPALYERLQTIAEDDLLPVTIWANYTNEAQFYEQIVAAVIKRYPAAEQAFNEKGTLWQVEDATLAAEIQRYYEELLKENAAIRLQSIIAWLEEQGFAIDKIPGLPAVAVTLPKVAINELGKRNDVAQIYLTEVKESTESEIAIPTDRTTTVWSRGMKGSGRRIAILESNNINAAADACLDIYRTRATAADSGHKSRVAAVAACNDPVKRGMAYEAQIADAGHDGTQADAINALIWATEVDQGPAHVVNWSASFEADTALHFTDRAIDYYVRLRYFTGVIAAGNTSGNVTSPGKGYNVVAVGNVDDKNTASWSDDEMHASSARINPNTSVEKPEVAAPGTLINTVAGEGTGTSLAAPQVAGLAALLMQRDSDLIASPSAVKAIIMASAVHNIEGNGRLSSIDGAGAIDAALADQIAQNEGSTSACNTPCWWSLGTNLSPSAGGYVERTFNAVRGERIRVAIAWLSKPEPPTDTSPDPLLRNFDLSIIPPSGTVYPSASPSNNFEILDFMAPGTGQYTIRVTRNNAGDGGAELGNKLGIAWVKQATYLPDLRGDDWTSSIYIRNDDAELRNVNVTFLNANGSYNSDVSTALNPNAIWINPLPPIGWEGSAIVGGSEDLSVVVVQERGSTYTHETYAGVGNPAADVLVPIVQRNNSGFTSDLFIMNAGGATTNVTTQFLPAPGYGSSTTTSPSSLAPGAILKISTSSLAIGNGAGVFVGSARVTNSAGQPLAIASTQYRTSGASQMLETSNTQLPSATLYGPLIQNNNSTWQSGLALSSYVTPPNFYVRYNPTGGTQCFQETPPPAPTPEPNPRIIFPAPSGAGCPLTPMARFQSNGAMTANVNQLQGAVNGNGATTYAAISMPSKTVSIAKVRRDAWSDGFVIANFNASAATVTVRIYNADGTENSSSPIYNTTLGAEQSVTILGQIPVNFNGSAEVNATLPVAVSVNSLRTGAGSGDTIGSYPGNHR